MAKKPRRQEEARSWTTINVTPETLERTRHLAALLSVREGQSVSRSEAVAKAVEAMITRLEGGKRS